MDGDRFRRASLAIWERMAPGWDARHAWMEATARPVIDRMLDRLAPGPGDTVLDLAAGSGVVGFAAASLVAPGGRVIVSDFSPRMVEAAARQAAALGLDNAEARVLDAERLALPDAAVDGVLCRWGFMLMGDPAAALREARRVLRTGGRIAFAVFGAADDNPWVTLPTRVLEDLGHAAPREPGTPGILALADAERLAALVAAAGFTGVAIEPVAFSWQFRDLDDYWSFLTDVAGAIAVAIDALDADQRERVRDAIGERLAARGAIDLPAVSLVVSARADRRQPVPET